MLQGFLRTTHEAQTSFARLGFSLRPQQDLALTPPHFPCQSCRIHLNFDFVDPVGRWDGWELQVLAFSHEYSIELQVPHISPVLADVGLPGAFGTAALFRVHILA
jgi:hypothetical protein